MSPLYRSLATVSLIAWPASSALAEAPPTPDDDAPLIAPDDDAIVAPDDDAIVAPDDDASDVVAPADGDGGFTRQGSGYRLNKGVLIEHRRRKVLRTGGSVQDIDDEVLDAQEFDNPEAVLKQLPSVQTRGEDGYGLRPNIGIRGTTSERSKKVTLMEDGVLFAPAPYSAPAAYYFPLMTRMTAARVYKGPAAILYGPYTVGGAIDLISRRVPYKLELGADLAAGTDTYLKGHGHVGATHFFDGSAGVGFLAEAVHMQSDGFKDLDGGGDTGFSRSEGLLKGRLHSDLDAETLHALELSLLWSRESSEETYLGLTDADFEANAFRRYRASARDHMGWDRLSLRADYTFTTGDLDAPPSPDRDPAGLRHELKLKVTAYRHVFDRAWGKVNGFRDGPGLGAVLARPTATAHARYYDLLTGAADSADAGESLDYTTNDRSYLSQGVQIAARGALVHDALRHELELGVRLHSDSVERHHFSDLFAMRGRALVADGAERVDLVRNQGEATALSAYLSYGLRWAGLTVTPGVRAELIETTLTDEGSGDAIANSADAILGGLGLHYEIGAGFGVLAGVHQGFAPVAPGQPDTVEPETSVNYEAGARWGDAKTGDLAEAIFFFNDYANLTSQCTFSSGCDPEDLDAQLNAGEADVYGLEVAAQHRFHLGDLALPVRLVYTFTQTELKTAFVSDNPQLGSVEPGDELPYVPDHQLTLSVGAQMARWRAEVLFGVTSPMREEASQGQAEDDELTDAQVSLDLFGSYEVLEGLQIYARAENLLMREEVASRRPYGARPVRPFAAQIGVKLTH